jgi:hypothetical protein
VAAFAGGRLRQNYGQPLFIDGVFDGRRQGSQGGKKGLINRQSPAFLSLNSL